MFILSFLAALQPKCIGWRLGSSFVPPLLIGLIWSIVVAPGRRHRAHIFEAASMSCLLRLYVALSYGLM